MRAARELVELGQIAERRAGEMDLREEGLRGFASELDERGDMLIASEDAIAARERDLGERAVDDSQRTAGSASGSAADARGVPRLRALGTSRRSRSCEALR